MSGPGLLPPVVGNVLLAASLLYLVIDFAEVRRLRRMARWLRRMKEEDEDEDFLTAMAQKVEADRLAALRHAQAMAAWEAGTARRHPAQWKRKQELEAAIRDLQGLCKATTSADFGTDFGRPPFTDLFSAEDELAALLIELDEPRSPPQAPAPAPSRVQLGRGLVAFAAFVALIAWAWSVMEAPAIDDFLTQLIAGRGQLVRMVVQLVVVFAPYVVVPLGLLLATLLSHAIGTLVGNLLANIAYAMTHLMTNRPLYWCLKLLAAADVLMHAWAKLGPMLLRAAAA